MRAADYEHKNQNGWPYLCFQGCDWPLLSDETTQTIAAIKAVITKATKKKKKKKKKKKEIVITIMKSWGCEDTKKFFSDSYDANAGKTVQNEFLCLCD